MTRIFIASIAFSLILLLSFGKSEAARISLEDYTYTLAEIHSLCLQSQDSASFIALKQHLLQLPEFVVVAYSMSNDETAVQRLSNNWLRNYFEYNVVEEENEHAAQMRAVNNLAFLLDREVTRLQDLGQFPLNDFELQKRVSDILKKDIYTFEDQRPEEKEKEKPTENAFLNFMERIWKYIDVILVTLAAILVIFVLIRLGRWLDFRKKPEKVNLPVAGGLLRETDPRDSVSLREMAEKHLKTGSLELAVRYYYLAFILRLHESALIHFNPALTNWEYQFLLEKNHFPEKSSFGVTSTFDESHYGEKPVNRDRFARFLADLKDLEQVLEQKINPKGAGK
ncbi:MAG: DUF4129 domain-containing protein [Bacteroidia bacterium]|nr:DUF4129 domain-containing protein [Bacteroidia bacterium]